MATGADGIAVRGYFTETVTRNDGRVAGRHHRWIEARHVQPGPAVARQSRHANRSGAREPGEVEPL